MPHDYYDFNPSATTWVLMLSCMVLFVVVLSLLLIYLVHRSGQATAPVKDAEAARTGFAPGDALAEAPQRSREATHVRHAPTARAS